MKLLDHTLTPEGYTVRIWLDELEADNPDSIQTHTRLPYDAGIGITKKQYEAQMLDQAMKLAAQKLAQLHPEPVVISENVEAKEEQQAAVEALAVEQIVEEPTEEPAQETEAIDG